VKWIGVLWQVVWFRGMLAGWDVEGISENCWFWHYCGWKILLLRVRTLKGWVRTSSWGCQRKAWPSRRLTFWGCREMLDPVGVWHFEGAAKCLMTVAEGAAAGCGCYEILTAAFYWYPRGRIQKGLPIWGWCGMLDIVDGGGSKMVRVPRNLNRCGVLTPTCSFLNKNEVFRLYY